MLKRDEVEAEEERLRELVRNLSNDDRKAFYAEANRRIKDPDTYAVLNWFFLIGLHHFYLYRWGRGLTDLVLFIAGLALLFVEPLLGMLLIIAVAVAELWTLFRSQLIVHDWNNRLYREILERYSRGEPSRKP